VSDVPTSDAPFTDVPSSDVPAANVACPASEPTSGAMCPVEGAICSYGDDPAFHCRDRAACNGHVWSVTAVDCTGRGMCPATPPSGTCSPSSVVCQYGDGTRCTCTECPGGPCTMTPMWFCNAPPMDPACPRISPQVGEACSASGVSCDYGACNQGWRLVCTDGRWQEDNMVACPL
jgi:hypothetical protein